eukprot:15069744-Ditylum_brightwellii.AAC.1
MTQNSGYLNGGVYAPVFMPCPQPLRARLHMPQTQRRPHQRGSPQKLVWCRRERSGSATSGFGGEGRRP